MTKHTIEAFSNADLNLSKSIASSFGRVNKEIRVDHDGSCLTYTVLEKRKEVYIGNSSMKAVDVFNDLATNVRNPITIEPFTDADVCITTQLASSYGRNAAKELHVDLESGVYTYTVLHKRKEVYVGNSSMKAVDLYNEL